MSLVEGPIPPRNILRMAEKNKSGPSTNTSQLSGGPVSDSKTTSGEQRQINSPAGTQNDGGVVHGGGGGRKMGMANLICSNSIPSSLDTGLSIVNSPIAKARKSSFQITRVVDSNVAADTDSMDDIDEATNTEQDTSSDNRDISRTTADSSSDHEDTVTTTLDTRRSPSPGHDGFESPLKDNLDRKTLGRLADESTRPIRDQANPVVPSKTHVSASCSPSGLSNNSSPTTIEPQKAKAQTSTPQSDIQSRFKIVKIIRNVRGRWKCLDFSGLPANETTSSDSKSNTALNSRSASTVDVTNCSNPIFYVANNANTVNNPLETLVCGADGRLVEFGTNPCFRHISELVAALPGQIASNINIHRPASGGSQFITGATGTGSEIVYGNVAPNVALVSGVVVPASSLLLSSSAVSQTVDNRASGNILTSNRSQSDPAFLVAVEGLPGDPSVITPLQQSTAQALGLNDGDVIYEENVDETASDYADSSGSNCALDNKIEQAMDLVKSHLMFAVHEEVELLKEQIKELITKNMQLEAENNLLRAAATTETLAKLDKLPPSNLRPDSNT